MDAPGLLFRVYGLGYRFSGFRFKVQVLTWLLLYSGCPSSAATMATKSPGFGRCCMGRGLMRFWGVEMFPPIIAVLNRDYEGGY